MPQLVRHADSPPGAIRAVSARAARTAGGQLSLSYLLDGELAALVVPAPGRSRIGWKLWRHTCCEAFLRVKGEEAYYEFNFSPSGEWAVYRFSRYREGATVDDAQLDPQIALERKPERLELFALVELSRLGERYEQGPLAVGLSAVIEQASGGHSYWALRHPAGRPDFHHADAFALELA